MKNRFRIRSATAGVRQLGLTDEASRPLLALAEDEKVDAFVRHAAVQALGQFVSVDEAVLKRLVAIAGDEKASLGARYCGASIGSIRKCR